MKRNKYVYILLFILILVFGFFLRRYTFSLPHFRGDQHHYVALALKLDQKGFSNYNLRGIDMYASRKYPDLVQFVLTQEKGNLLQSLEAGNITYYDQPLHHVPFGFPAVLALSHKVFARGDGYFLIRSTEFDEILASSSRDRNLRDIKINPLILPKQFYAVIVPLASSLILAILTFFLAEEFFKNKVIALVSMYLVAISPIDILASQKVWADDLTAALTLASVLLFLKSSRKNSLLLSFLGGILCGLSAITKQSGAFIIIILAIWHYSSCIKNIIKRENVLKNIFPPLLIMFVLGAFASSAWWFGRVYLTYGSAIYRPEQANIANEALTGWFKTVGYRPSLTYLLGIPYQNPMFLFSYIAPLWIIFDKKNAKKIFLLSIWAVVFLYIFQVYLGGGGKEHRYMLPSYPAFAILASYVATKFSVLLDEKTTSKLGTYLLIFLLIASALWSVPMAFESLFNNDALIMKPF